MQQNRAERTAFCGTVRQAPQLHLVQAFPKSVFKFADHTLTHRTREAGREGAAVNVCMPAGNWLVSDGSAASGMRVGPEWRIENGSHGMGMTAPESARE